MVDAALEPEDAREEKVMLDFVETVLSEALDKDDMERWRAMASKEACLVCEGARLGILGTSGMVAGLTAWFGATK